MLSKVIDALKQMDELPGVTDSEVKGFGQNRARAAREKVVEDSVEYAKKAKLEIVVPDHLVEEVIRIIREKAHTGNPGDGKIFVEPVEDVVKVRTGERGEKAV
ncbi:MAG: P-II family nitrogen regulator [Acidobacteriota bacterium]